MKKLLMMFTLSVFYYAVNAQTPIIIKPNPNVKLKKTVRWVCTIEDVSSPRLTINASVKAEPGKNELITVNANLSLERIEFYSYTNQLAITIGVAGSGEVFNNYTFDFSGVNGYEKDKGIKLLCYRKGSTLPDAIIIVTPLITYQ